MGRERDAWVRLHYVYPYPHVDEVLELMADGLVLPYLDIPFQHGSPEVLKRMKRPAAAENTLRRIAEWRRQLPNIALRSTFIVGFPGETEQEFSVLLDWLREARLDRVGCFKYSPVEGATANALPGQVAESVKEERWQRFMEVAAEMSAARLAARVGTTTRVLVDGIESKGRSRIATARSYAEAPEIDGHIVVKGAGRLAVGDFVDVKITAASTYDLSARPLRKTA
jgi:ribosomal protein S12 methylthiotransferase